MVEFTSSGIIFTISTFFGAISFFMIIVLLAIEISHIINSSMSFLHSVYLNYVLYRHIRDRIPFYYKIKLTPLTTYREGKIYSSHLAVYIRDEFSECVKNGHLSYTSDRVLMDYKGKLKSNKILDSVNLLLEKSIDSAKLKQLIRDHKLKQLIG